MFEALHGQWRGLDLEDLDLHFARQLLRLEGADNEELGLACVLVSRATREGHVCLDLAQLAGSALWAPAAGPVVTAPALEPWVSALRQCQVVGVPGEEAPLILDGAGRLYLYRYWRYENCLAEQLLQRVAAVDDEQSDAELAAALARLFPPALGAGRPDWQQVAAAVAARQRLCVISGGPGTGKTTTVARVLALLLERHRGPQALRIALAAPTGKAAARLQESIRAAKPGLATSAAVRGAIPERAATLHRLLGVRHQSSGFRHHAERPLPVDVLVVDEASMVDVALMAKLLQAVPPRARLLLLGDKDQLASVEAGAVLADMCRGGGHYSPATARALTVLVDAPIPEEAAGGSALGDAVVVLRHSYRFAGGGAIGRLAQAVNAGDVGATLAILGDGALPDATARLDDPEEAFEGAVIEAAERAYGDFALAVQGGAPPGQVFAAFHAFRFLCAHRLGRRGTEHVNRIVEGWFRRRSRRAGRGEWYPGRPVMVARNDYAVQLFNGDVGIALPDPARSGELSVFFQAVDGGLRAVSLLRLPPHETVFAMSVHKSQGSEFNSLALVLPATASGVCSRELVYTGVTRARQRVQILSPRPVLEAAVRQRLARSTGLAERLEAGPCRGRSPGSEG